MLNNMNHPKKQYLFNESNDDLSILQLQIDPRSVYFLRFILEAYDNLYIMTTIDRALGLVEIRYAAGAEQDLRKILTQLSIIIENYKI